MPTATKPKLFTPCPEGEDILCKLMAVEEVTNDANARFNPGGVQWKWVFETLEVTNEEDDPIRLSYYTGTEYLAGNAKCKLTKLLDKICKTLTVEEKEVIDTDTLTGKKFRLDVIHVTKPDGTVRAQIESIKRAVSNPPTPPKKAAPVQSDDDDDDSDPFEE